MKEAAKMVDMSYSTAKKIYGKFRKQNVQRHSNKIEGSIRAEYVEVPPTQAVSIPVICLLAGRYQN